MRRGSLIEGPLGQQRSLVGNNEKALADHDVCEVLWEMVTCVWARLEHAH